MPMEITLDNVHDLSLYELRKELERRGKWTLVDPYEEMAKKQKERARDEDSIAHLILGHKASKNDKDNAKNIQDDMNVDRTKVINRP